MPVRADRVLDHVDPRLPQVFSLRAASLRTYDRLVPRATLKLLLPLLLFGTRDAAFRSNLTQVEVLLGFIF